MSEPLNLDDLNARVAAGENSTADALEALGREVIDLKQLVAQLMAQENAKIPRRWATYANIEDWQALVTWVDELNQTYSLPTRYRVRPCWPAHPGVVEELAALWQSWKKATTTAESAHRNGTNDYIAWHDRWLWPALRRLESSHYNIANCSEQHTDEATPARLTDHRHIPPEPLDDVDE